MGSHRTWGCDDDSGCSGTPKGFGVSCFQGGSREEEEMEEMDSPLSKPCSPGTGIFVNLHGGGVGHSTQTKMPRGCNNHNPVKPSSAGAHLMPKQVCSAKIWPSTTWPSSRGPLKPGASVDELIPLREPLAAWFPAAHGSLQVGSRREGLRGTRQMEPGGRELCQHRCEQQAAEGSEEIPAHRVCERNSFQRETSKRLYQVQLSHCAFHLHTLARQSGVTTESPFTVKAERSIIKVN